MENYNSPKPNGMMVIFYKLLVYRIMRYLNVTIELEILYQSNKEITNLIAYTNRDFAGDLDNRKNIYGFVFMLVNGAISQCSKKQQVVALPTTEAEYIVATSCAYQCIQLKRILEKLGHIEEGANLIQCDNIPTIQLSKNLVIHGKSKRIDIKFHSLRDLVRDRVIRFGYCNIENQATNILTKQIKKEQFLKLRRMIGMA